MAVVRASMFRMDGNFEMDDEVDYMDLGEVTAFKAMDLVRHLPQIEIAPEDGPPSFIFRYDRQMRKHFLVWAWTRVKHAALVVWVESPGKFVAMQTDGGEEEEEAVDLDHARARIRDFFDEAHQPG